MEIDLVNWTRFKISLLKLNRLGLEVLLGEKIPSKLSVEVLLVGEKMMRQLNQKHRQVDRSTTVISFPQAPNPHHFLGTIVLCPVKIRKERKKFGFYFQHGLRNLITT
ncbi:rRNA maturation RNAse YbeY [Candidatus Berkelbacteria bacterium]|nr:rRNA maturation RNAse YbeY [Candidatus Berkelbacteria bacterium]MBI2588449.1 rRNA maturation RNAse YbeY [Candidatus Berkelbacteria bacterium]MBI4029572.1 rRNA maturation RNAse YbeY [Candidatus Berkelbacteria bacterium]